MKKAYKNGEEFYNKIYLQFNALIAVSLLPFGYLLLQKQTNQLIPIISEGWMYTACVSVLLLSGGTLGYVGHSRFNQQLFQLDKASPLRDKLDKYRKISVKKYFNFLLVGLIYVAALYVTNSSFFIVGYIMSIVLLSIKRPTLNGIIEDLKLPEEEQKVLIEKKDIV